MSTQSTAGIDDAGTTDHPSRSDGFVRGISERHRRAARRPRGRAGPAGRPGARFWTAARIVLALACLTLALHWVQKSPCQDGAWQNNIQYTRFCYTDVLALYYAEGLNEGKVPYRDHPVEYPVLTGYFMGALGLPVHALGDGDPSINQGQWFYNLNALVLGALAVATVAVILALRRRRPWDAAMFALAPALLLTATVNWDLLAIGLAAFGLLAWARRRPAAGRRAARARPARRSCGRCSCSGRSCVLALRADRLRAALVAIGDGGRGAWCWSTCRSRCAYPENWDRFFELNTTRPIDWGTLWYIGRYLDGKVGTGARRPGAVRVAQRQHPDPQHLSYALFGLACLGVGRAGAAGAAPTPAGSARLPGGRRVPDLQQGLVAAVRALAAAAGGAGPAAVGRLPGLADRRGLLLRRLLRRAARRGDQPAGLPRGGVRAGLDAAAGHRGGALRASWSGRSCTPSRTRCGPPTRTTRTAACSTAHRTRPG